MIRGIKGIWLILVFMVFMAPGVTSAQRREQRYELGGLVTYTFLRGIGSTDAGIGTEAAGLGGRIIYRGLPFLHVEGELNVLPGNSASAGNRLQGFFGVKAGKRWEKAGIFLKARPGFIHFSRDPFGVSKPGTGFFSHERAASTEPSIDFGSVVEYYTARGVILRFDIGDTIIRYARRTVQASAFQTPFQAGGFTSDNWQASFGAGLRF